MSDETPEPSPELLTGNAAIDQLSEVFRKVYAEATERAIDDDAETCRHAAVAPELLTGDPEIDQLSESFRIASDKMRPLMYAELIGAPDAPFVRQIPPIGSGRVFLSSLQDPTSFEPAAFIPTFLCRYCQNWYPASSLIKFGDGLERCEKCQERHNAALEGLAGNPPKECGMCQITFELLQDQTPGNPVRMKVIMVDGTYVLACMACYDAFVQVSRALYKGTRFGAQRKL